MPSLTLAIPGDLKEKMKQHPEINWSEVARQAITEKAALLDKMNRILSANPLSRKEASMLESEIKKRVWKKQKH